MEDPLRSSAEGAATPAHGAEGREQGAEPEEVYPPGQGGNRRRIGIFGGSFDPVHRGHLAVARRAAAAFALHEVVFVPAARPPHKPGRVLAEADDRVAMLELALAREPEPPRLSVSTVELGRSGPSYTFDTVCELPALLGWEDDADLHLIIGSDNLPGLPTWHAAEELLRRVQPIVVYRGGALETLFAPVREHLPAELVAKIERGFLELDPLPGRSTDLRRELSSQPEGADRSAARLEDLPVAVREYIAQRGIYSDS